MTAVLDRINPRGPPSMLDLFDLTGKVAVVTGGNGGIGQGIARGFSRAGASVVLVGRNVEKSAAAVRSVIEETGAECYAVRADVAVEADVKRAVAEIVARSGPIRILVNNAGMTIRKPPHELRGSTTVADGARREPDERPSTNSRRPLIRR